jgi:hypothetical protein
MTVPTTKRCSRVLRFFVDRLIARRDVPLFLRAPSG